MSGECHKAATYVMYEYLGNYHWGAEEEKLLYACPKHVEQLAAIHRITAADIRPYDD
jgi:hypothetical protein